MTTATASNSTHEMAGITGDILLDAGTNEFEVLVFSLSGGWFGVNVAKVREVIKPVPLVAAPAQQPSVLGMFNIRGAVLPVVDLAAHLSLRPPLDRNQELAGRVIITEFNGLRTGFLVDSVDQIHRLSWRDVKPTPDLRVDRASHSRPDAGSTTGTIQMGDRLVLMIDFESVADAILLEKRLRVGAVENELGVDRGSKRVLLVEDSPFMRGLMTEVLRESGYAKLEVYPDGQAAWEAVQAGGDSIDAIISDIEMPRMDGLTLTRQIKDHAPTRSVPVVLFSSLISDDNLKKGRQVGADVQMPKPELFAMVRLVDQAVSGNLPESSDAARITIGGRTAAGRAGTAAASPRRTG